MDKRLSVLFVFLLFFQTITSGFAAPAQITAEGKKQNVIDQVSYKDEQNNKVNIDEMDDQSTIYVHIDWSVHEGVNTEGSHSEQVPLHEKLQIVEEQAGATEIGAYQVTTDGTIAFDFTEVDEEFAGASGTVEIEVVVDNPEANEAEQVDKKEPAEDSTKEAEKDTADKADEKVEAKKDKSRSTNLASVEEPKQIKENIIDELNLLYEDGTQYQDGDFLEL